MIFRVLLVPALLVAALSAAPDRLLRPVDSSRMKVLKGMVHPKATPAADLGAADPSMPIRWATMMLRPSPGLEAFLAAPHQPLTPEQFAERFGVSGNDTSKVVAWLQSQGMRIEMIARGRQFIVFSGTAETVGKAFRTEIHRYGTAGKVRFANSTDLSIPADLDGVVSGFRGLNNFGVSPMFRGTPVVPEYNSSTGVHYIAPDDIATIYDTAPLYAAGIDGTGQRIAVAGQTDIDIADIRAFRAKFNLPPNDPKIMLFGPDPGKSSGDILEADIDLEWSGAVAPNATIIYVNSGDAFSSAFYAIDNALAPVLSTSYGACEVETTADFRTLAQQASAEGMTWISASGDSAAAGCDFSTPTPQATKGISVILPASAPEVTAIGGTQFNDANGNYWAAKNNANLGSALGYIPEGAWNESLQFNAGVGGGGGASAFYPKPFWQTGLGVPNDGARDVPDVSLNAAAYHDSYLVYSGGSLTGGIGGTSVGTPIFASMVAMLNQYLLSKNLINQPGLGNINPTLYRLAQTTSDVFHDVVAGTNVVACAQGTPNCVNGLLGYSAGIGYDLATGLGSVDAFHMITEWKTGTLSTTALTASPANANLNDTVTLVATITTAGGAAPTGAVTFLSSQNILGTVNVTPAANGVATATLGINEVRIAEGDGRVQALYNGDAATASSGATATVNLIIPASGSLVIPSVDPNPVYQFGGIFEFTVSLQEAAGVATKLTGFTIDGTALPLNFFSSTNLPAFGLLQTTLASGAGINPSAGVHVFGFAGTDTKSGKTWTQQVTAVFLPSNAPAVSPSILLTSVPSTVQRNFSGPADCQWSQQLTVQEQSGFLTTLSSLKIGTSNLNSQIQTIFGTTRLAPYGMLYGNLCWDSANVTPTKTITIGGVAEIASVSSTATAAYANAPAVAAGFGLSVQSLTFTESGSAPIDVTVTGGDSVWTTSILPANITTRWLTVTAGSGEGPGRASVQVSTAGLSNGVYMGYVTFQATNAFPQAINVPVTLIVGPATQLPAGSIVNAASGYFLGAPGEQMLVKGVGTAVSATAPVAVSVPLGLGGFSATVNGIAAPILSVGPAGVVVQVPYETAQGTALLAIAGNGGQTWWQQFPVAISAPGIFPLPAGTAFQPGASATVYITGDGDATPTVATGTAPSKTTAASKLPKPRLPVSVTVASTQAKVGFYGLLPDYPGVTQINFTVPLGTPSGYQPVVVTVGSMSSLLVNVLVTAQ